MKTSRIPLATFLAFLVAPMFVPLAAWAAVEEIPVTTRSADARLAFIAGQAALDRGDAAEANTLFRTAVAADPDFTYAWVNLGTVAFSTEEFDTALKGAERGAARASDGERQLLEFNKLALANDVGSQLELAKRLTATYPRSPRAWMVLQGAHAALNQFAEQRAVLEKIVALDPHFAPAPFALGGSYLFSDPKDFAKAEQAYRQALAIEPGHDIYYWSIGDVYRASNRLEDARRYYRLAAQLDPKDLITPVKLGHVNSFLGNFDDARKDYDAGFAAAGPANAAFLGVFKALTWVYAGDPKKAIAALDEHVARIDGLGAGRDQVLNAKVFALTNLAQIALYNGMFDEAARALARRSELARENARLVGTPAFSNIQESLIVFWDAQLAAWRGDYKSATALARKNAALVAGENNARKMEGYHELLALIELRRKNYAKAVAEYRMADLTQLHNKYQLALALEGAGRKDEAMALYREVSTNNFNTVDFALLRAEARKKAG